MIAADQTDCNARRLYNALLCLMTRTILQLSYRGFATYLKDNTTRKQCGLKYCPSKSSLHAMSKYDTAL